MKKVLVVGLGQLGLPVAKYIQESRCNGIEVYGYDVREEAMDNAWRTAAIPRSGNFRDFDIYIICIATHRHDNMLLPQTSGIFSVVERISKEGKDGSLVSIESTVPKGTSRKVFEMLNHRMHVVHAPHRWYAQEEKEHGVNQLRVIGGAEGCCLDKGLQFYCGAKAKSSGMHISPNPGDEPGIGIPMHLLSNIELAELTKIIENAHRYLQIAFAEDLYLYSEQSRIDFWELRQALNTKWNVEILEPRRNGIGGHCLPKDTRMFIETSQSKMLKAAIEVDADYQMRRNTISPEPIYHVIDIKKQELPQPLPASEPLLAEIPSQLAATQAGTKISIEA